MYLLQALAADGSLLDISGHDFQAQCEGTATGLAIFDNNDPEGLLEAIETRRVGILRDMDAMTEAIVPVSIFRVFLGGVFVEEYTV